jgi:phosphoribosylpyrophosphate synthetase
VVTLGSSHNHRIQKPCILKKIVKVLSSDIKELNDSLSEPNKIQALVCCGISGAGVAFPISCKLDIPVWIIRKEGEKSHSRNDIDRPYVDTPTGKIPYVIIDDLIDSGATIARIIKCMNETDFGTDFGTMDLVRCYLYNDCYNRIETQNVLIGKKLVTFSSQRYSGWGWSEKK